MKVVPGLPSASMSFIDGPNALNGSAGITNTFAAHLQV